MKESTMPAFSPAVAGLLLSLACAAAPALAQTAAPAPDAVQRGRYLVQIAGCNDCHTPNYGAKNGKVDESLWLTGDALGWQGPWGTTYASNLRLLVAGISEEQWVRLARTMETRPPMPWFNLRAMTDADLKAMYAYVRASGPAGSAAPAYVPPGGKVSGPVARFP